MGLRALLAPLPEMCARSICICGRYFRRARLRPRPRPPFVLCFSINCSFPVLCCSFFLKGGGPANLCPARHLRRHCVPHLRLCPRAQVRTTKPDCVFFFRTGTRTLVKATFCVTPLILRCCPRAPLPPAPPPPPSQPTSDPLCSRAGPHDEA